MTLCKHQNLVLLPPTIKRLRCRECHLTIKAEELTDRYCPECYESSGKRNYDFEPIESEESTRYRCEDCHLVIEYIAQEQ
ncbi:MAG: hypothetical protein PVI90_04675 [Desulfobacteraceae bacterium]|jgi:hypothetical protein